MVRRFRRLSGVPRAVFRGLLRETPGGLTFQAPRPWLSLGVGSLPTAVGLGRHGRGKAQRPRGRPIP